MDAVHKAYYKSEIGILQIEGTEKGITLVEFVDNDKDYDFAENHFPDDYFPENYDHLPVCMRECIKQLDEYFKGERKTFSVELLLKGTDFQLKVWQKLKDIPYGGVISYKQLAENIGNKKAVRAVGGANNKNRISIILPCHRVIGSDGSLTGYGGGLWRKEWLLEHEKKFVASAANKQAH